MKSAATRTFSLLSSLAFLLAAIIVYAFLVRPAYDNILVLRSELEAKNNFFQEQSRALGKVNDLILEYRELDKLQDTISLTLPLKEDLSSIFNQLRALASANGLSIQIFSVKPLAFKPLISAPLIKNVGTLQLSLRLSGSYESFRNFLRGVETNIRLMDIQQIKTERVANLDTNFFDYNVVINAYYQAE